MAFNGIELGLLPNGYYKYCSKEFVTETILLFTIFPPTITSCSFHKYISKQIRIHIIIRYTKWHRIPVYELPWIERHKTMLNEMQNCRLVNRTFLAHIAAISIFPYANIIHTQTQPMPGVRTYMQARLFAGFKCGMRWFLSFPIHEYALTQFFYTFLFSFSYDVHIHLIMIMVMHKFQTLNGIWIKFRKLFPLMGWNNVVHGDAHILCVQIWTNVHVTMRACMRTNGSLCNVHFIHMGPHSLTNYDGLMKTSECT